MTTECLIEVEAIDFQQALLNWARDFGRHDLPWQINPTPYRVWVSEIMLQQTQVQAVMGYYTAFMGQFPDVETLASASEDDVLAAWSGLGYYARARNLHRAAQEIVRQGGFPSTLEGMMALPGIGRSTAGAILSLSLGQAHPILDGNVKRVLARVFAIKSWPGETAAGHQLWALSERLTPSDARAGQYNQAMMDLGSGVCRRSRPLCAQCPVVGFCQAKALGLEDQLPRPKPQKDKPVKTADFYMLAQPIEGQPLPRILLQKQPSPGLWGGLYAFPSACEALPSERLHASTWPVRRHTFSHFHLDFTPHLWVLNSSDEWDAPSQSAWHWYNPNQPEPLGLPAPISRLLEDLSAYFKEPLNESYDLL